MKTLLDVHTHTIASGHAFSSLQEMTLAAKEKGLEILGITEHGPHIPGTCDPIYFRNLHCVPRQLYGIKLMLGAELNILNTQGDIDLDEDYWRMLDIRIAGIHSLCWQGGTKEENTQGVINAMRNPFVQIISHPGDGTAELDFEALMKVSKETHTLLEINNHSMAPIRHKTVAAPNNLELLELAKTLSPNPGSRNRTGWPFRCTRFWWNSCPSDTAPPPVPRHCLSARRYAGSSLLSSPRTSPFSKQRRPLPGQTAGFGGFFPISASRSPLEQGKSVSSAPRKPPALREVVAALAHNSVRAFSCSSSFRLFSPQSAARNRPKSVWQTQMGQEPYPTSKEGTQPLTGRYAGRFSLYRRVPPCGRNSRQYSSNPDTIPKRDISAHSRIRNTTLS